MTEEQIFTAALDLPDGPPRAAFLDKACGGDAELRRQVEALLASHFRTGEFLKVPAAEQIHAARAKPGGTAISDSASPDDESTSLEFLAPSSRPDSLGRLGRYEVLQVLGQGGFGIVLRSFDEMLQRVVAIKVLAPQLAVTSPARKRFLREARASAAARHENVVQIYEVGEQPLPFLVMEFIPGETLQQYLDRTGPLDIAEILRIGRQIAQGLAAAHASDLIHRDIKPGNILLEAGQRLVKITDFGLARAADDASLTQSGMIAGTPLYMAPEQAQGQALDQRADLFSLGSVLYQMVTGRPPFRANTTLAALKRVTEDTPRPIREIIPETPHWLCDIITKLHAKDPAKRYQSAREVATVLAAGEARLQANSPWQVEARVAPQPLRTGSGRRTWLIAAASLLLVIAIVAIGPSFLRWLGNQNEIPPRAADDSFSKTDTQRIAALPATEQVAAVAAELKKRNPNSTASLHPTIDGDRVIGIDVDGRELRDISPLSAFKHLQSLSINECAQLSDLSPLRGLPLETLSIRGWSGTDLKPLQGMPLKVLNCSGQGQPIDLAQLAGLPLESLYCNALTITNLAGLRNMPLQHLQCAESNVSDLSPLRGLSLSHLNFNHTSVRDLSPLLGMPLSSLDCQGILLADLKSLADLPLVEIYCDFEFERDAPLLRSIKTLERINDEPAGEVLKNE